MSVVLSGPLSLNRILVTRAAKEQGATGLDKEHEIYQHAINWRVTELFCFEILLVFSIFLLWKSKAWFIGLFITFVFDLTILSVTQTTQRPMVGWQ